MWRLYALIVVVWVAMAPPLFTGGACTAEFEATTNQVLMNSKSLNSPDAAISYFQASGIPVSAITPERCRESKPRFMSRCGPGTLVYAKVPVKNSICSFYRDSDIKVYIDYDDKGRPQRFNTDMAPYKSLPIPGTKVLIHWGR
jgi:hypothetical protein